MPDKGGMGSPGVGDLEFEFSFYSVTHDRIMWIHTVGNIYDKSSQPLVDWPFWNKGNAVFENSIPFC